MAFNEKYVADTATGGGTGTLADPWTFDEGVNNCAAGDRINVKAGNYTITANTTAAGQMQNIMVWRGYTTTPGDLDGKKLDGLVGGVDIPKVTTTVGNTFLKGYNHAVFHFEFITAGNYMTGFYLGNPSGYSPNMACHCRFIVTGSIGVYALRGNDVVLYDCYFEQTRNNYSVASFTGKKNVIDNCVFVANNTIGTLNSYGVNGNNLNITNSIFKDFTGHAVGISYTDVLSVQHSTFINNTTCITLGITNGGHRTVTNCYFADCTTGIDSSWTEANRTGPADMFIVANNVFKNVTNETVGIASEMIQGNTNDAVDNFADSANDNYSLSFRSAGYGSAFPSSFDGLSTPNGRDVGAAQHADPQLSTGYTPTAGIQLFPFRQWVEDDFGVEIKGSVFHPLG